MGFFLIIIIVIVVVVLILILKKRPSNKRETSNNTVTSDQNSDQKQYTPPGRFSNGIKGTARNIEQHEISDGGFGTKEYLGFLLEIIDDEGNIKELIDCAASGKSISGRIREGDTVIVLGKRNRRGLLKPKRIFNTATRLEIKIKGNTLLVESVQGWMAGIVSFVSLLLWGGALFAFGDSKITEGVLCLIGGALTAVLAIYLKKKSKTLD